MSPKTIAGGVVGGLVGYFFGLGGLALFFAGFGWAAFVIFVD